MAGVGNSAADISLEIARSHETWLSGKESGHIRFPIDTFLARHIAFRIVRFIGHHILTLSTPTERKARPKVLAQASPLVRVKPQDLIRAGIKRVDRVIGIRDGRPLLSRRQCSRREEYNLVHRHEPGLSWMICRTSMEKVNRYRIAEFRRFPDSTSSGCTFSMQ